MTTHAGFEEAMNDSPLDRIAARFYRVWRDHFAGVIDTGDLVVIKAARQDGRVWVYYECPCGGDDHYATRPEYAEPGALSVQLADILTCYTTNQQWLVRPIDVAGVIRREEEAYLDLLTRSAAIIARVKRKRPDLQGAALAAYLKDTHGIDDEAEDVV